jgi:hypothetical protein
MSSPTDNFKDFFDNPESAMKMFKPTPDKIVEALMVITSQNHEWYKDSNLRMIVLATLQKLGNDLEKLQKENGFIDLPVHAAAFLMLLGDLAIATMEYASEMEKNTFHYPDDSED